MHKSSVSDVFTAVAYRNSHHNGTTLVITTESSSNFWGNSLAPRLFKLKFYLGGRGSLDAMAGMVITVVQNTC